MIKKNYFLSADFQANPTDISWQQVVFLVIQNYALLFLSWTAFTKEKLRAYCPNIFILCSHGIRVIEEIASLAETKLCYVWRMNLHPCAKMMFTHHFSPLSFTRRWEIISEGAFLAWLCSLLVQELKSPAAGSSTSEKSSSRISHIKNDQ